LSEKKKSNAACRKECVLPQGNLDKQRRRKNKWQKIATSFFSRDIHEIVKISLDLSSPSLSRTIQVAKIYHPKVSYRELRNKLKAFAKAASSSANLK
jgi:hypothetical protein